MKRLLIWVLVWIDSGAILAGAYLVYQAYFPPPTATFAVLTLYALIGIGLLVWATLLTVSMMLWRVIDRQDEANRLLKRLVVNTRQEPTDARKASGMASILER